jgi:hypothetical protein
VPERPRYLSLAIILALTLGLAPAAAAEDTVMMGREAYAEASWMFPKAKPGTFTGFLAFAIDQDPSMGPDVISIVIAMSGPCRQRGDTTMCEGKHGNMFDLKPGQLEVASDYSTARLNVGKRDERVSLTWTGEGVPLPGGTGTAGGGAGGGQPSYEFETDGMGITRQASVEGKMFGHSLGADGLERPATFYGGHYTGRYRQGDRFLTIGSVTWRLPRFQG